MTESLENKVYDMWNKDMLKTEKDIAEELKISENKVKHIIKVKQIENGGYVELTEKDKKLIFETWVEYLEEGIRTKSWGFLMDRLKEKEWGRPVSRSAFKKYTEEYKKKNIFDTYIENPFSDLEELKNKLKEKTGWEAKDNTLRKYINPYKIREYKTIMNIYKESPPGTPCEYISEISGMKLGRAPKAELVKRYIEKYRKKCGE